MNPRRGMLIMAVALLLLVAAVFAQNTLKMGGPDPNGETISPERQKVYAEIEGMFGFVPGFLKSVPDHSLALEWHTMKAVQMDPGPIPNKYRELIGLAVAAARGCEYCTYFHTQFARLNGATDAELEDAVHFAKSNLGWSTYLHGTQFPLDEFKRDVDKICANVMAAQAKKD